MQQWLSALRFDNRCLRELPVQQAIATRPIPRVANAVFVRAQPDPVERPVLVAWSASALGLLGLSEEALAADRTLGAELFSGNRVLPGAEPAAHCYCGFQFGYFSGQLGDGAAMYLGEIVNPATQQRWELQLKGAGLTAFSRDADGRKVLRSSLREFLCSEAMHALGVPTTRAGTVVTSESTVVRDQFYSGQPQREKCSVVTRIAPSFLRFGSFEVALPRDPTTGREGPSSGNPAIVKQLVEFTIAQYFPQIAPGAATRVHDFLGAVAGSTARLVAKWQTVGFCHGVLNTDNMSILGLTLDYGPFGFQDYFDNDHICNTSDDSGRYDYKSQVPICRWNVMRLHTALSLAGCLDESCGPAESYLEVFDAEFKRHYGELMRAKLGLGSEEAGDEQLFASLFATMHAASSDFTLTFRTLGEVQPDSTETVAGFVAQQLAALSPSVAQQAERLKPKTPAAQLRMLGRIAAEDPALLARMGIPVEVLKSELAKLERAEEAAARPESEASAANAALWSGWVRSYMARLDRDMLRSTGAGTVGIAQWRENRRARMATANPVFVLRNYVAQRCIEAAERGDYGLVAQVVALLQDPFHQRPEAHPAALAAELAQPPRAAQDAGLCVSCSS